MCHTPSDINTTMNTQFISKDYFKVNLFMVDTIISPQSNTYINSIIESEIFLTFAQNSGSRGIVRLGHYAVTNDDSIWPVEDLTTTEGYFVESFDTHTI